MKKIYFSIILFITTITFSSLYAQGVFYSSGFESSNDTVGWVFVNDSYNSWAVGNASVLSGSKGLYVSNNGGSTATYHTADSSLIMAYYTFTLPVGVKYAITFDWRANGEVGSDELSVCFMDSILTPMSAGVNATYPNWYAQTFKQKISGARGYSNCAFEIVGSGQPQRVVFIWKNNGNNIGVPNSGCIDNFYIHELSIMNYDCDFSDSVENAKWKLQGHRNCVNKWVIGGADYNSAPSALYISPDSGATSSYVNNEGWVTASRTFILSPGVTYDISFDWKCFGEVSLDYMYVCWVTDSTEVVGSNANTSIPSWSRSSSKAVNPGFTTDSKQMVRSSTWKSANFSVIGTGKPARLVFLWVNNASKIMLPGGVIDNIQIYSRNCPKPEDVNINLMGTAVTMTWSGTGSNYEILYHNDYGTDDTWFTLSGQTSPAQFTLPEKGRYAIWIRNVCDSTENSIWVKANDKLVVTNEGCINYLDFSNRQMVQGSYGSYSNPYANQGIVDFGQYDANSRHTVNISQDRDERTDNMLQVIPPGDLASIRLGNWLGGGEAEGITFTYVVDSAMPILLLRYAVVLEDPSHDPPEQPLFKIEILDMLNRIIDPICGAAEFIPGVNTTGWHIYGDVVWHDWDLIGLNLSSLAGQNIKIRLTTKDCIYTVHYGYAYFSLDCDKAALEGISCGESTPDSVCAPKGFSYLWYKKNDPYVVVSQERCIQPTVGDTCEYVCKVIYPTNPGCFFNVSAVLSPRWPLANATFKWNPTECNNTVEFRNLCTVTTEIGILNNVNVDEVYWDFGNGMTSHEKNPIVDYGPDGGTFNAMIVASMANDECLDTFRFEVVVPKIESNLKSTEVKICEGQSTRFNGKYYTETGTYRDTLLTAAGCDSILELKLTVSDLFEVKDTVVICEGEPYDFNGILIYDSGDYQDKLITGAGCDSVVYLNITINPVMKIEWNEMTAICEDDESFVIGYQNNGSTPTKYSLMFNDKAKGVGFIDKEEVVSDNIITIPLPSGIRAGVYEAQVRFVDEKFDCGEHSVPMNFVVNYSKMVIKQLWNDVLGLKNMTYNGGYDFQSYQWYRNDSIINGATKANYYVEGGELDFNSYYQARILRSDGVELFTCPFYPQRLSDDINVTPITIVSQQFIVEAPQKGKVKVYSSTGILVMIYDIMDGENELRAPSYPGVYLVKIELNDGLQKTTRLIVNNK